MTDPANPPHTVALNVDAPPGPDYVTELAEAMAEIVRCMNRQTMYHEALAEPADGYRVFQELSTAAGRLPQLLDQIARWYEREAAAGKLEAVSGEWGGFPGMAAVAIRMRADAARMTAEQLGADLASLAEVTSTLAPAETREGGTDG